MLRASKKYIEENPRIPNCDEMILKSIRLYEDEWLAAKKIHSNFSAFARRAVLEKIERDKDK